MVLKKCVVKGCGRTTSTHPATSFFSFPKVKDIERETIERRRTVWIQRTHTTEEELLTKPSLKICGRHFILGTPCYFREINNLDWAPTLHLEKQYVTQSAVNRFVKGKQSKPRVTCEYRKIVGRGRKKARLTEENEVKLEIPMEVEDASMNENLEISILEQPVVTEDVLTENQQLIEKIVKLEAELKVAKDFATQNQQLIEKNLELEAELIVAKEKALHFEKVANAKLGHPRLQTTI